MRVVGWGDCGVEKKIADEDCRGKVVRGRLQREECGIGKDFDVVGGSFDGGRGLMMLVEVVKVGLVVLRVDRVFLLGVLFVLEVV